MDRRLFIAGAITAVTSLAGGRGLIAATDSSPMKGDFPPIVKTREEWRQLLQAQQYQVLFEEGTERPWTSPLNDEKRDGTYVCAACYLPLFLSETKFDSGTGWPSFYQAIEGNTGTKRDWKLIIPRTEYHCARCGGHQGHVFDDGPQPTGQRWCNNGVALLFIPSGEELPALRM
ncbi:MAG: peptide-methionine (R)-S-oxide reductase MsrB [Gammaproteobacteria bacterium]